MHLINTHTRTELGVTRNDSSFLKEFTGQLSGTNKKATATLKLLDALKIKSELLGLSLSVNAGVGGEIGRT